MIMTITFSMSLRIHYDIFGWIMYDCLLSIDRDGVVLDWLGVVLGAKYLIQLQVTIVVIKALSQ